MNNYKSQTNFAHIHSITISQPDLHSLMQIFIKVAMHLNNESLSKDRNRHSAFTSKRS